MKFEYPPRISDSTYKLKTIPEDFTVEELFDYEVFPKGSFVVFKLYKSNTNTNDAVKIIALKLNLKVKDVGYAGLKDKNAVTVQYISIPNKGSYSQNYEFSNEVSILKLEKIGYRNERIFPGCLARNSFEITVRNLEISDVSKINDLPRYYINFFGEQRFSEKNHLIGSCLIKKKYKEAISLIIETFSGKKKDELILKEKECKGDYLKVLNLVDRKLLRIYLHSFQSELWNKSVYKYLEKKNVSVDINNNLDLKRFENFYFPLVGFDIEKDIESFDIVKEILDSEELSEKDFILRSFQGLGLEGGKRSLVNKVFNEKLLRIEDDEFNLNKKKIVLRFELTKGSYATEYIRQMFS